MSQMTELTPERVAWIKARAGAASEQPWLTYILHMALDPATVLALCEAWEESDRCRKRRCTDCAVTLASQSRLEDEVLRLRVWLCQSVGCNDSLDGRMGLGPTQWCGLECWE